MVKVKTSELTGLALRYAVAVAEGWSELDLSDADVGFITFTRRNGCYDWLNLNEFRPDTDWSQGGPIIDRKGMYIGEYHGGMWMGNPHPEGRRVKAYEKNGSVPQWGETYLIAGLRCHVASELGDEVEIPDELIGLDL